MGWPMTNDVHLTDDCGNDCTLVPPPDGWKAWRSLSGRQDPAALAEKSLNRATVVAGGLLCVVMVNGAVGITHFIFKSSSTALAAVAFGILLSGVLCWYYFVSTLWFFRARYAERIKRAYKSAGRCPSCGYDLDSLGSENEALTVCPECGSSWRLTQADDSEPVRDPRHIKPWHLWVTVGVAVVGASVFASAFGGLAGLGAALGGAIVGTLACMFLERRFELRRSRDGG